MHGINAIWTVEAFKREQFVRLVWKLARVGLSQESRLRRCLMAQFTSSCAKTAPKIGAI